MKLKVLASGSSGNGFVLSDENDNCLVIEAGLNRKSLKLTKPPDGFLVSHQHQDHAKFEREFEQYFKRLKVENYKVVDTDNFKVAAFQVVHNIENQGFVIYSKVERKIMLFATDLMYNNDTKIAYKQTFDFLQQFDFDLVAIECNYNKYEYDRAMVYGENIFGNEHHLNEIELYRFLTHLNLGSAPILLLHKSSRLLIDEKHTMNFLKKRFKNDFAFAKSNIIVKF